MIPKLRTWLARIKAQATPTQSTRIARVLALAGCVLLWRAAHMAWPTIALGMVGLGVFAAWAISHASLLVSSPGLRGALPWSVAIFIGGFANFAVIIANGGYMPAANQYFVAGMYCPIDGANLAWLADWIWGTTSPGDVLIVAGAIGMVAVLIQQCRARRRA